MPMNDSCFLVCSTCMSGRTAFAQGGNRGNAKPTTSFQWNEHSEQALKGEILSTVWSSGDGLVSGPSPPGRIAYLALVAVRHHAAVDFGERCALGNHRLRDRNDGQARDV